MIARRVTQPPHPLPLLRHRQRRRSRDARLGEQRILARRRGAQRLSRPPLEIARAWSGCRATVPSPPFALERLDRGDDQHVIYRLPTAQRDGNTVLSLTPQELIDQLAAQMVH